MKLSIIVGSTRPGRLSEPIAKWVQRVASGHAGFTEVALLDLRDWELPMFNETLETIGDRRNPTYSSPVVKRWNETVKQADAFVFVTPEYNHSVPGVLKNAIDSVFVSFGLRNKPAGFVGYSAGPVGGARAVEHLAHIAIEAEMVPLRNAVLIGGGAAALDADGTPRAPLSRAALDIMLDDVAWWGQMLLERRARGELPPGNARLRMAMEALKTAGQ